MLRHVVLTDRKLNYISALRHGFVLIFSALFFATLTDQFLNKKIEALIRSADGISHMIWIWGLLSIASSLFFPVLIALFCCYALAASERSLKKFISENLELTLLEVMRTWGKAFTWSFIFIIPGLIKYLLFQLTPFVVFFSDKYKAGQVDALDQSTAIAKKFPFLLFFYLMIFFIAIPMTLSSFLDEYRVIELHPGTAILSMFFESLLILLFHYLILQKFFKYLNEIEPPADSTLVNSDLIDYQGV